MSYSKAANLLTLATMVASRRTGTTIDDVMARFSIAKRTAQRMLRTLEDLFQDVTSEYDHENRKRWYMPNGELRELMTLSAEELAACDLAIETLKVSNMMVEADELFNLREKVLALVPRPKALRLETDYEALLEAQGLAARPGPRQRFDRGIATAIWESIKACRILEVDYQARSEIEPRRRRLLPYGLLTGLRRYLVALAEEDASGPLRLFLVEKIVRARVTHESFERDQGFSIRAFANRSFGVFQKDEEFGEVVWRFTPEAAERARAFEFHPCQSLEDQPDGSLIVRFSAAGHLEMAWHLYLWGDHVEVLAPECLREMVQNYRRSDFASLP